MKSKLLAAMALLAVALAGCRNYRRAEVINESFVHKYGVPVPKADWAVNGKSGQVIQLLADGVTVSRTYQDGVLQGTTTYTFPNSSTIAKVEAYEKGSLVAKTSNYLTGIPKEQEKYEGNAVVELDRWYEDGTPALVENYEKGLITHGEYKTPLNVAEGRVEEGMGVRLAWTSAGALLSKDIIRDGQMIERISYFESGEPQAITPYENGVVHGVRQTFLPGGLPNTVEEWVKGQQEGVTVVYLNGAKVAEVPYVKGKKEGMERRFRDGESLAEEVSWKNGNQHGPRKIIISECESRTEWYQQGQLVSRPTYERMNKR